MKKTPEIITVGSPDQTKRSSPFVDNFKEATKNINDSSCYYNDNKYSNGSIICMQGSQYQCSYGNWIDEHKSCGEKNRSDV